MKKIPSTLRSIRKNEVSLVRIVALEIDTKMDKFMFSEFDGTIGWMDGVVVCHAAVVINCQMIFKIILVIVGTAWSIAIETESNQ